MLGMDEPLATIASAMGWAASFGLTCDKALARVVREWKNRFEEYGVAAEEIDKVSSAFKHVREIGEWSWGSSLASGGDSLRATRCGHLTRPP